MERIAVWGSGICGQKTIEWLQKDNKRQIVLVVDKNKECQGKSVCGHVIQSPEDIIQKAKNKEIDAVIFAFQNKYFKEATALFRNIDVKGYVVPRYIQKFQVNYDESCLVQVDMSKPRLKQFDVNLADHCNLKCKGCLRFSNLVETPMFSDYDSMIKDWKRIKELFWGVERLKLMGGEPLLNPELGKYIQAAREIFPDADIMVTTNALLINENCQELFKTMKKYQCYFDISLYEPMEKKSDELEELLNKYEVDIQVNMNNTAGI